MQTITRDEATILRGNADRPPLYTWHSSIDALAIGTADKHTRLFILDQPTPVQRGEWVTYCKRSEVSAIHWMSNVLVTGGYDGCVKVFEVHDDHVEGSCIGTHEGLVSVVKLNKEGTHFVSGGEDNKVHVWNLRGRLQTCCTHSDPILDIDWLNNDTFASCSIGSCIYVHSLHANHGYPVTAFIGHSKSVNTIKWDPEGRYLASCSDDKSIKIWQFNRCICTLLGHSKEVFSIDWSPCDRDSSPMKILASGSFDSTVKLWNVPKQKCIMTLRHHERRVVSVAFSPDRGHLASASEDRLVCIWDAQLHIGALLYRYEGTNFMYDVSWSRNGTKVAACSTDGRVHVLNNIQ